MSLLRRSGLVATVIIVAACSAATQSPNPGASAPSPAASVASAAAVTPAVTATPLPTATPAPSPSPTPQEAFHSKVYGYSLTSLDWTGTATSTAWDGTGSSGDGDPWVDALHGPLKSRAWGVGVATTDDLKTYADKARAANATAHPCKLSSTRKATVDGVPAVVDENTCEVFAMSATIVRKGHAHVFFTYGAASDEAGIRTGFESLLKAIAFD